MATAKTIFKARPSDLDAYSSGISSQKSYQWLSQSADIFSANEKPPSIVTSKSSIAIEDNSHLSIINWSEDDIFALEGKTSSSKESANEMLTYISKDGGLMSSSIEGSSIEHAFASFFAVHEDITNLGDGQQASI